MSNPFLATPSINLWPRSIRATDEASGGFLAMWQEAVDLLSADVYARLHAVVAAGSRLDTAQGTALLVLAAAQGVGVAGAEEARLRRWVSSAPEFQANKGDLDTIRDAIFVLTGIVAVVTAPWQDGDLWVFEESEFGVAEFGFSDYRPVMTSDWVFGEAEFGEAEVGDATRNLSLPYELRVEVFVPLTLEQRTLVEFAVGAYKRAVDRLVLVEPDTLEQWVVGTSTVDPAQVARIVLPSGSAVTEEVAPGDLVDLGVSISFTPSVAASLALEFSVGLYGEVTLAVEITPSYAGSFTTDDDPTPRTSGTVLLATGVDLIGGGLLTLGVEIGSGAGATFTTTDDATPQTSGSFDLGAGDLGTFGVFIDVPGGGSAFDIDLSLTPSIPAGARASVSTDGSRVGIDTITGPGAWIFGVLAFGLYYFGGEAALLERVILPDGTPAEDEA